MAHKTGAVSRGEEKALMASMQEREKVGRHLTYDTYYVIGPLSPQVLNGICSSPTYVLLYFLSTISLAH